MFTGSILHIIDYDGVDHLANSDYLKNTRDG